MPGAGSVGPTMSILGQAVSANGSTAACVQNAVQPAWRAFWPNCGRSAARGLSGADRRVLLEGCVWPVIAYRAPRWQLDARTVKAIDSAQRWMFAMLQCAPPFPGEDLAAFVRRRARCVAAECGAAGLWSQRVARLVVQWAEHVERERRPPSHSIARLATWHAAAWCAERRRVASSPAMAARRIDARAARGHVALRRDDAVATARAML